MSNYLSGYKTSNQQIYSPTSPVDFKKSSAKGSYYTSAVKDFEIQDLKNKYGINTTKNIDKYSDPLDKFDHIQKVRSQISDLRATYNPGQKNNKAQKYDAYDKYDKWDKYDQDDFPIKQNLRKGISKQQKQQPLINLRHTINQFKTGSTYDYSQPYSNNSSTGYTSPYRKKSAIQDYNYQINIQSPKYSDLPTEKYENNQEKQKDSQKSKIDFDKINEKLKSNAAMIQQLRKLRQERKWRNQNKNQKSDIKDIRVLSPKNQQKTNCYDQDSLKVNSPIQKKRFLKSFETEVYTPKYDKKTQSNDKLLKSISPTLQKSKSYYLETNNTTSSNQNQTKSKQLKNDISVAKSSKQLFKKSDITIVGDFFLQKNLGQGKFGTVFRAFHKSTGAIFAIKKVPKQMIKSHFMIDQFILELKIQSFFNHKNILKIFGFFDDKQNIYLILEYMQQGTLFTYFKKNKTLDQKDAAKKIRDVSEAVLELHQSGVAHRDIKPQNIVMSNGVCKLCDFGWATICNQRRKTYCGTFDYAAPEILQGVQYDMSVDQWCIGILAYQLMVGKAPFYHISRKQTMKKIMNAGNTPIQYPSSMSKKAINFIEKLIIKNPQERMKAQDIIEHQFLKINDEVKLN